LLKGTACLYLNFWNIASGAKPCMPLGKVLKKYNLKDIYQRTWRKVVAEMAGFNGQNETLGISE